LEIWKEIQTFSMIKKAAVTARRQGAADRGEYSEIAGLVAKAMTRTQGRE
jgi:hypothetical protein